MLSPPAHSDHYHSSMIHYCHLPKLLQLVNTLCVMWAFISFTHVVHRKSKERVLFTHRVHILVLCFFAAKSSKQKKDTTKMCLNGNGNIKIKTRKKWRKESEMVSQKSGQIISLGLKAVKVEYSAHQTWFLHFYFTLGYSESWFIC